MSVLFGLISAHTRDIQARQQTAIALASPFGRDGCYTWHTPPALLGRAVNRVRPQARPELRHTHTLQHLHAVASARIDNRIALRTQLGISPECSDTEVIIHAYQHWGAHCVEHLEGDFAFAVWDEQQQRLFCARDRAGIRPFHYRHHQEQFAFASTLPIVAALDEAGRTVDGLTWLAHYARVPYRGDASYWQHCRRLPPGCALSFNLNNKALKVWRYWLPEPKHFPYVTAEQWAEAATEQLQQAIRSHTAGHEYCGLKLSGGLDSSVLLALLSDTHGAHRVRTVSSVLPPASTDGHDEREHQQLLVKHFQGVAHGEEWDTVDDPLALSIWQPIWAELGRATNLFYPKDQQLCANLAKRACRVVMTGFWGDATLSYQGQGWLTGYWRNQGMAATWAQLQALARREGCSSLRVLGREWRRAYRTRQHLHKPPLIAASLWQHYRTKQAMAYWDACPQLAHPLSRTLLSGFHCIEEFTLAAARHGMELSLPFLDTDFCTLMLSAPANVHVGDGWRRYLARLALQQRVPAAIWQRQDKQAYAPHAWQQIHRNEAQYAEKIVRYGQNQAVTQHLSPYLDHAQLEKFTAKSPIVTASTLYAIEHLAQHHNTCL